MPLYEYHCNNCNHNLNELQGINDPPLVRCPRCHCNSLKKLISSQVGFKFKGIWRTNSKPDTSLGKTDSLPHRIDQVNKRNQELDHE